MIDHLFEIEWASLHFIAERVLKLPEARQEPRTVSLHLAFVLDKSELNRKPIETSKLLDLLIGRDARAMSALHGAVICNQPSIVKYLIDQGADVNAKNRLGWTPLMIAGGLYISNAHKTSPGSAEILRAAQAK